jgi:hypothetical protein
MKHGRGIPWVAAALLPLVTGCAQHPGPTPAPIAASERAVYAA